MTLPPSMKTFDISGSSVKIDVAAIEWPANATALVHECHTTFESKEGAYVVFGSTELRCRTTDPDESKEGAETSEIRIKCRPNQVIGTFSVYIGVAWRMNKPLKYHKQ